MASPLQPIAPHRSPQEPSRRESKEKTDIEAASVDVAQKTLVTPPTPAPKPSLWSRINPLNWMGRRQAPAAPVEKPVERVVEDAGKESPSGNRESKEENKDSESVVNVAEAAVVIPAVAVSTPVAPVKVVEAAQRAEQVKESSWTFRGAAGGVAAAVGGAVSRVGSAAKKAYNSYTAQSLDANNKVQAAQARMMGAVNDQHFVDLHNFVSQSATTSLKNQFRQLGGAALAPLNDDVLEDIIKINLANAFANLAESVRANKEAIPNYENQSSLVNLLILLSQKGGAHVPSAAELATKSDRELRNIFREFAGDILTLMLPDQFSNLILPPGYSLATLPGFRTAIYNLIQYSLLPDLLIEIYIPLRGNPDILAGWKAGIEKRIGPDQDINALTAAPAVLVTELSKGFIQFNPTSIGVLTEALTGSPFVKDRSAVASDKIKVLERLDDRELTLERQSKEKMIRNMSNEGLASWILQSAQTLLNSSDPSLAGASTFLKGVMNRLTLGLLAKGTDKILPGNQPDDQPIDPNKFIEKLLEGAVEKLRGLSDQEQITEKDIQEFIKDLPIPPLFQGVIVPLLTSKAANLVKRLQGIKKDWAQILDYDKVKAKVLKYEGGARLVSISDQIADTIVNEAMARNLNLLDTFGLEDSLDSLIDKYLPGVKIDSKLKEWLKANINTLGVDRGSLHSIDLLKEILRTVLLQTLTKTIETKFDNQPELFTNQLLRHLKEGFKKSFPQFTDREREVLSDAAEIHRQIKLQDQEKEKVLAKVKEFKKSLNGLPQAEKEAVQQGLQLSTRLSNTQEQVRKLKDTLNSNLRKLNAARVADQPEWNADRMEQFSKALAFYKKDKATIDSTKEEHHFTFDLTALTALSRATQIAIDGGEGSPEMEAALRSDKTNYDLLIELFKLPKEQLELVRQYDNTKAMLPQAEKELALLKVEFDKQLGSIRAKPTAHFDAEQTATWTQLLGSLEEILEAKSTLAGINHKIAQLEVLMDAKLGSFQILSNEIFALFGLSSKENLQLTPELRDWVWPHLVSTKNTLIPRLLFDQLYPAILPALEREANKAKLQEQSPFLAQVCAALSKDVISFIPQTLSSYSEIASRIIKKLNEDQEVDLTPAQIQAFANKVVELVENAKYKEEDPSYKPPVITNKALLEAYQDAMGIYLSKDRSSVLLQKLKDMKAKEEIGNVLFQVEDLVNAIVKNVPTLKDNKVAQKEFVDGLQKWIHTTNTPSYTTFTELASDYLETALVKLFINIAQKHAVEGKDHGIVLTEKLLDIVNSHLQTFYLESEKIKQQVTEANRKLYKDELDAKIQAELDKVIKPIADHLVHQILTDVLAISSAESFEGLPPALQKLAYDNTKHYVSKFVTDFYHNLKKLEGHQQNIRDARENLEKILGGSGVSVILGDIGNLTVDATLDFLNNMAGVKPKGVTVIGESTLTNLQVLSHGGLELARVLADYSETPALEKVLGENLAALKSNKPEATPAQATLQAGRMNAAKFVGNLLLEPLNNAFSKLLAVENQHRDSFNAQLITNLMNAAAEHFKAINGAKALAKEAGRTDFSHADFIAAAKAAGSLHAAVPERGPDYKDTIEVIEKSIVAILPTEQKTKLIEAFNELAVQDASGVKPVRVELIIEKLNEIVGPLSEGQIAQLNKVNIKGLTLKDLLRKDAEAVKAHREAHFYKSFNKQILKALFPNGRNDLTFVQPELRSQVWKILKTQLAPMIMPMMIELILDPDTITTMMISSLETLNKNLKGPSGDQVNAEAFFEKMQKELGLSELAESDQEKLKGLLITVVRRAMQEANRLGQPLDVEKLIKDIRPIYALDKTQESGLRQLIAKEMELDQIDRAAGNFMLQAVDMTALPPWIIKLMKNEKGEINPALQKSLGSTLRDQFNHNFMSRTLKLVFENFSKRDELGRPIISADTRDFAIKEQERATKRIEKEKQLDSLVRESVNVGISYFVNNKWNQMQNRLDKWINDNVGSVGAAVKRGLDKACRLIFFTIIGTVLSYALYPFNYALKWTLYKYIGLDETKKIFMDALRKAPKDQPVAPHVVYNENLAYKIVGAFEEALRSMEEVPT